MAKKPAKLAVESRPAQQVAAELRDTILGYIRVHWYRDLPPERFFGDRALLLRFVVLWPAKWLAERGVSLPAERYKSIMVGPSNPRGILVDAATLGEPARNPIRYLGHVVQSHWRIHGETYYEEAKALRPRIDQLMSQIQTAAAAGTASRRTAVELMADAAALAAPTRRRKPAAKPAAQLDLL